MSDLIVHGGKPLTGTITPSGNKNSALPILCATLLTDAPVRLLNVPAITDVDKLVAFFTEQGSKITWDKATGTMTLDHSSFDGARLQGELPSGMRSSVLLFAPLLHRLKKIAIPTNAKGCSLGIRELDPHLEILEKLGAKISHNHSLTLTLKGRFRGGRHWPDYMSVTATENFVMAAALAEGTSTIINAASEPHVQDLCAVLVGMGAKISGLGTSQLTVEGVKRLKGGTFTISNQGAIGGAHFTPIINLPEVAILGLGRGAQKAVVRDGQIVARLMTPVALSYDHRVIDGGSAARFTVDLVKAFENFDEALVKI